MCLNKVTRTFDVKDNKKMVCWKVFQKIGFRLPYFKPNFVKYKNGKSMSPRRCFKRGRVYIDFNPNNIHYGVYPYEQYQSGFHAYIKQPTFNYLRDSLGDFFQENYKVLRVELRKVHTVGEQNGKKVAVGKEMKIL